LEKFWIYTHSKIIYCLPTFSEYNSPAKKTIWRKPLLLINFFMEKYGRGGGRSGGFGGGRGGFGGEQRREMFRATCDECGASCQVPFKPT